MVEPHLRSVIDVNVVHFATVGAHPACVIGLEPLGNRGILAARRVEIDGAATCMKAGLASATDPCARTVCGYDPDLSEFLSDLGKARFQNAGQAFCTDGFGLIRHNRAGPDRQENGKHEYGQGLAQKRLNCHHKFPLS